MNELPFLDGRLPPCAKLWVLVEKDFEIILQRGEQKFDASRWGSATAEDPRNESATPECLMWRPERFFANEAAAQLLSSW
jgi:hypothetical protein